MKSIDEASVKKTLTDHLKAGFTGKLFSVQNDVRLSALFAKIVYADIAVFDVDGKPVAVFEVKRYPQAWTVHKQLDFSLTRSFDVQGIKYSVLTDGDDFYMWSRENREYLKTDFDTVLDTIENNLPVLGEVPATDEINHAITEAATKVNLKQNNAIKVF